MRSALTLTSSLGVVLSCLTVTVSAVTLAVDDASNPVYADGWQAGDNGGTGFGPWELAFTGDSSGLLYDAQFIDLSPLSANSLGAPAFGLTTSDRPLFRDTSEARRSFVTPLSVGQTFSLDVDGSELDPAATPFTTGNTFQLFGSDGVERFALFTNNQYNNNNWTTSSEINTGIPAGGSLHIEFTLVGANTYDLALLPIGGGAPLFAQEGAVLMGTAEVAIDSFLFSAYGTGSSANGSKELFFDNIMVTVPGDLNGDYNRNGSVEASDYVVWRSSLGQTGSGLPADGNGNNQIDAGDYDIWRANFNPTSPTGEGAQEVVPEPATWPIASAALICLLIVAILHRGVLHLTPHATGSSCTY